MGLYERWTSTEGDKLAVHTFTAAMREVIRGRRTLQALINFSGLDAAAQAELTAIAAKYQGLSTEVEKIRFELDLTSIPVLCEAGILTRAEAKDALGF